MAEAEYQLAATKGKAAEYEVKWCALADCSTDTHVSDSFMLQANGNVQVDLTKTNACADWLPISPVYTDGKFKND